MLGSRAWNAIWMLALGVLFAIGGVAAPFLTTIQDTLYKADGTRFNGVAFIEWKSFQTADSTQIATHSVTVIIVNGQLRVRLVPTTGSPQSAHYTVRYSSEGRVLFQETWAVPPSTVPLKLKDVRQGSGSGTPGEPAALEVTITDVLGLETELASRPVKGTSYVPSRVAVIAADGSLEGAMGSSSDCVRVDGTSGPCEASGGAGQEHVDAETPAGVVDGANTQFTLTSAPSPTASFHLWRNGLLEKAGLDYTLSGNTVTFASNAVPQGGDVLLASYRMSGAGGGTSGMAWTLPQVVCSSFGNGSGSASWTSLGSCTIPGGVLLAGDRVEARFNFSHEGSTSAFSVQTLWGGTTVLSRTGAGSDAVMGGQSEIALGGSGGVWSTQSWTGTAGSQQVGAGTAADAYGTGIVVSFQGQMAEAGGDTVTLRGFTVLRYPAQVNP